MDPRSEVVLRQEHLISGQVLLINPPSDQLISQFNAQIEASVWTWNFADQQYFEKHHIESHFGVEFPDQQPEQVIIFVPKSKELLSYLLHVVASYLNANASIFLVGEKKGGVERAAKQLHALGKSLKLDSARHCQMWQCILQHTQVLKPLEAWLKTYRITLQNVHLDIAALPGVFSQNHLDVGTALFLPYLDQVKSGKLADFGCGAGVISAYLAKLHPKSEIYALDIDAFALKSTEMTFAKNDLPLEKLSVQAVTGIIDAPFDLDALVSNPPFHQGIHTHYAASEALCAQAKQHLVRMGELWIVANRFLNYADLIEQQFGQCKTVTDQQGFKVLYATAS